MNRLRKVEPARRHGSLVCFLWQSYHDAVDQVIDMFDKLITRVHTQAKQELDDQMCAQRRAIKVSLAMLDTIGSIVLNDDVSDSQLRSEIYARVPKSELTLRFAGISEWVSGKKSDWFHGVMRRHGYLRKFSPTFLKAIQFKLESEERSVPCMQAVDLLRELNDNGKRKLPDDAPIDFIPERLTPIVKEGNGLNRRAWECALLTKLRDEVKAGNIAVESSKRFGMFSDYFMPDLQWDSVRDSFFGRSELPSKPDKVHEYLSNRLEQAYDIFLKSVPGNSYATVDQDGWHLSVDSAEKIRRRIGKKIGEPSQLA